jgi:predicted O-methyltransferase YrrM
MNIRFWLTHPRLMMHRWRYFMWQTLHPSMPWLCPGTVEFCARHIDRSMRALEFGSGRSTSWFAERLSQLTSVEHDSRWYQQVKGRLATLGLTNVDYRYVPLDHPEPEGEHAEYDPVPAYVRVADDLPDRSLDLVIADGHYRTHCIRHSVPKIKPGGYLLVDDVNFWQSVKQIPVPADWKIVDESTNGLKTCIIWQAT